MVRRMTDGFSGCGKVWLRRARWVESGAVQCNGYQRIPQSGCDQEIKMDLGEPAPYKQMRRLFPALLLLWRAHLIRVRLGSQHNESHMYPGDAKGGKGLWMHFRKVSRGASDAQALATKHAVN